jgi:peptide/nickel transport system ATP-binding protein
MAEQPRLSVRNLRVEIQTRHGALCPVDDVSFDVQAGEILGLVGESGAGKSMIGNVLLGLEETPVRRVAGEMWLDATPLHALSSREWRSVRGKRVGMIFQDPLTSLNPLRTIGQQLQETLRQHLALTTKQAQGRAVALLQEVGIPAAESRLRSYPHQFSGGMRQRVVIALALAVEPALLIADEPTTALDVSVQAQIMALLRKVCDERGTSVLLITHDMGVVAETTDRMAVLYAGRLAELGPTARVIQRARHPYTRGLVASTPSYEVTSRLQQIAGSMPALDDIPTGCAFHPRCECVTAQCRTERPKWNAEAGVACWHPVMEGA